MDLQGQEIFFAISIFFVGIALVLFLFIFFVFNTQRKVVRLQKKLIKAEIISAERERARVASDLHDALGSSLAAVLMAANQMETQTAEQTEHKQALVEQINTASNQVRHIAHNMVPKLMEGATVEDALHKLMQTMQPLLLEKGIQLHPTINAGISIPVDALLHLYRAVQEILFNAFKHSGATDVYVTCLQKPDALILVISDNGKGFDVKKQDQGLGMSSIQNRMMMLEAEYSVESKLGNGTEIMMRIQLNDLLQYKK